MLTIRPARSGDEDLVVEMVRALAEYEQVPLEKIRITADDIRKDCLGEKPRFHVELAISDGKPAGFVLYFFTYSSSAAQPVLYLEKIFVDDAFWSIPGLTEAVFVGFLLTPEGVL